MLSVCDSEQALPRQSALPSLRRRDDSPSLPYTLIGDIHDAALDRSLWPGVLAKAARFVGGPAASLLSKDPASRAGTLVYDHGIDPHYKRLYCETYIQLDPASTGQLRAAIGEPVATADVIRYDDFVATRFYREWAAPQGLVDFVSTVLDRSAGGVATFGVFRESADGLVDDEARRRMRLITPHIRRAVLIGRVIDVGQARLATLHDVLDGLTAGFFLIDARGHVRLANASGRAMLARADLVCTIGGRLAARHAAADRALRAILAAVADGDGSGTGGSLALPLATEDGEGFVAHVQPLTGGERRGGPDGVVAALFVDKVAIDRASLPAAVARHYGLTATEARVLASLAEEGSGPAVADALGIGASTVKTHLARIYRKTGARGQIDLVKLVAGFAGPLIG